MKDTITLYTVAIVVILLLITGIGAANFIIPAYAPEHVTVAASPSLTGTWQANDGGTYHLRQIGNTLWWIGMSGKPGGSEGHAFSNVFKGTITPPSAGSSANTIVGEWTDTPRGQNRGFGKITLHMESYTTLVKISQTGGFFASLWEKKADLLGSWEGFS